MNKRFYRLLYVIGALLTLMCAGIAIWPDLEARNFSSVFTGKDRASLSCPIAITTAESSSVRLKIRNPLERRARFAAISFISSGNQTSRPAEERQETYIEAKDSGTLEWSIDESNRAYDRMVLARIYVFRSGRAASQSSTCGVWLIQSNWAANSGFSGQTIYFTVLTLSLIMLFVGGYGVSEAENPLALLDKSNGTPRYGMVLTITILLALAFGLIGVPMVGIFAILLAILLLFSQIERGPDATANLN